MTRRASASDLAALDLVVQAAIAAAPWPLTEGDVLIQVQSGAWPTRAQVRESIRRLMAAGAIRRERVVRRHPNTIGAYGRQVAVYTLPSSRSHEENRGV